MITSGWWGKTRMLLSMYYTHFRNVSSRDSHCINQGRALLHSRIKGDVLYLSECQLTEKHRNHPREHSLQARKTDDASCASIQWLWSSFGVCEARGFTTLKSRSFFMEGVQSEKFIFWGTEGTKVQREDALLVDAKWNVISQPPRMQRAEGEISRCEERGREENRRHSTGMSSYFHYQNNVC